jgi:hypothetical protein
VTGHSVSDPDMPNFPWPPGSSVPPVGDSALDELLATGQPPQDAAAGLRPVADVLAALQAAPSAGELTGKTRAMAEFRETIGRAHRPRRVRLAGQRKTAALRTRASSKLAAVAAAAAVVVAAGTVAAYVGALPAPLQKAAHDAIYAPAAKNVAATATRARSRAGVAAADSARRLCTAYQRASANGGPTDRAAAFRDLERAARGPGNVTSFCASAYRPGATDIKPGAAQHLRVGQSPHRAGEQSARYAGKRPDHDRGTWSGHPGGERSGYPAGKQPGHPAGDPSPRPPGGRSARPHDLSHREAGWGSAPGAQRPSQVHPPALSGRGRGC